MNFSMGVGCFFSFDWWTEVNSKKANTELMPSEEDKLAVIVSHVSRVLKLYSNNTILSLSAESIVPHTGNGS